MKIKNESGKILGIGLGLTVLPGETMELPKEYVGNPILEKYDGKGLITLVEEIKPAEQGTGNEKEEKTILEKMSIGELQAYALEKGVDIGKACTTEGIVKKIEEFQAGRA